MTSILRQAFRRLRAILARGPLEDEMQDEMREHIERATERFRARGMSDSDARLEARREFGNRSSIEEQGRDARGARWMDALGGDLRFAFRYFGRHKATVAIVVAVLALGISANTVLFSVHRAQFLKPAAGVPDDAAQARFYSQIRATQTGSWNYTGFTLGELASLAERRDIFSELSGEADNGVVLDAQAADSVGARAVVAHFVSPNYFRTLGITLSSGRSFSPSEDAADLSAVIGFSLAERLYGNVASAVGRRILVNETPVQVIGVANEHFEGASKGDDATLWIPLSARPDILRLDRRVLAEARSHTLLGRLAPGATHEQATAFAQHVVTTTLPDSAARVGMTRTAHVQSMTAPPPGYDREEFIMATLAISVLGGLILLVGWMNVSSLMVAAAVARRHEIAVRLSLGASRVRLLRQLVTESTLLAIAGGAAGVLLGYTLITLLTNALGNGVVDPLLMPDGWTLLFVVGLSVSTGIIFGLSPALHATRAGVSNALRDSGTAMSTRSRLQGFFVAAQIALSQPLLVILGVILSVGIADVKPLAPETSQRVIAVFLRPLEEGGAASQGLEAVDALLPRLRARPEIQAAVHDAIAFDVRRIVVGDRPGGPAPSDTVPAKIVLEGTAPGWFELVDVPIIAGRDVQLADTIGAERNVVIGSDFAQRLWGGASPIGRRLPSPPTPGQNSDSATLTVVGVYDAAKARPEMALGVQGAADAMPRVHTAHGKKWRRDQILVRTRGAAEPYLPELNRVLRAEIPSIPVRSARTLEQIDQEQLREAMNMSAMAGMAGVLALLLASLGLYGVVSLAVQQRTREIGIRIAVGARSGTVTRMFLASGVRVSLIAMAIGLPLSVAGYKVGISQGLLVGENVNVYLVGASIAALLVAVACAATWVPARRASRVDPATTLRT